MRLTEGARVSAGFGFVRKPVIQWGGIGFAVLFALVLIWDGCYIVRETERVVLTETGKFVAVKGAGFHLKLPFIQDIARYRIDIQAFEVDKVNTYTVDNQELDAHFTVNFRIPEASVERVFRNVPDYKLRLTSLAVDRFKAEIGRVNVTEIAQKRADVRDRIRSVMVANAREQFGLEITDFQVTNIDYNKAFRDAVTAASIAKAKVDQALQEKHQAQIVAETAEIKAKGEAASKIAHAEGEAKSARLRGEADAAVIALKGEAEAKVIKQQVEALKEQGPNLVELRKSERWDGKLPATMLGSVMPFMNVDQYGRQRAEVK